MAGMTGGAGLRLAYLSSELIWESDLSLSRTPCGSTTGWAGLAGDKEKRSLVVDRHDLIIHVGNQHGGALPIVPVHAPTTRSKIRHHFS